MNYKFENHDEYIKWCEQMVHGIGLAAIMVDADRVRNLVEEIQVTLHCSEGWELWNDTSKETKTMPKKTLQIAARLDELKELQDGWLEGVGRAPSADGLGWLSSAFEAYFPDGLPLPYLYPTEDGCVRAEWSLGKVEASGDINLASRVASWHELDLTTDAEDTRDLDLSSEADWAWLVDRVRSGTPA